MTTPTGRHAAAASRKAIRQAETATQIRHPWRATARTVIQLIPIFAAIIPAIVDAFQDTAPEWLAGWGPAALAGSIILTRIMQEPQVNKLLSQIGLGAEPRNRTVEAPAEPGG